MSKLLTNIKVPTGNICIMQGEKGKLEFLSIGDYGKSANIKADFLDITREIDGVPHGDIMPLSEKWVITLSSQYGCNSKCTFCDVPTVGKGLNATYNDLKDQVEQALLLYPEVNSTKRLNIHYARMGEPSWNPEIINFTRDIKKVVGEHLKDSLIHPVFTTMFPRNNKLLIPILMEWCDIKNNMFDGNAGLQLSINSTDENQRTKIFGGSALSLLEISDIGALLPNQKGRKYALNIALSDDTIIDESLLVKLFPSNRFMVKITPLHKTNACDKNNMKTTFGYTEYTPYKDVENRLKGVGFDVLVFIPSLEEDLGRITCGNAILSGTLPQVEYKYVQYERGIL